MYAIKGDSMSESDKFNGYRISIKKMHTSHTITHQEQWTKANTTEKNVIHQINGIYKRTLTFIIE